MQPTSQLQAAFLSEQKRMVFHMYHQNHKGKACNKLKMMLQGGTHEM